jgi:hypothetical protein
MQSFAESSLLLDLMGHKKEASGIRESMQKNSAGIMSGAIKSASFGVFEPTFGQKKDGDFKLAQAGGELIEQLLNPLGRGMGLLKNTRYISSVMQSSKLLSNFYVQQGANAVASSVKTGAIEYFDQQRNTGKADWKTIAAKAGVTLNLSAGSAAISKLSLNHVGDLTSELNILQGGLQDARNINTSGSASRNAHKISEISRYNEAVRSTEKRISAYSAISDFTENH